VPTQLVLDCFPEQQQALLAQLAPHPQQQFAFLKGLVALHQAGQAAGQGGNGSLTVRGWVGCARQGLDTLKPFESDSNVHPVLDHDCV